MKIFAGLMLVSAVVLAQPERPVQEFETPERRNSSSRFSSEPSTAGRIVEAVMQPRGLAEEHRAALPFALPQTVST